MSKQKVAIPKVQLDDLIARYRMIHGEITALSEKKERLGATIKILMAKSDLEEYTSGPHVARSGQRLYRFYRVTKSFAALLEAKKIIASIAPGIIDGAIEEGLLTEKDVKSFAGGEMKPYFEVRAVKEKVVIGDG